MREKYSYLIEGVGIEVGARDNPLPVNKKKAQVKYVDIADKETQIKDTPSLKGRKFVKVNYYSDIRELPFTDGSQDFVICNHVLEHVPDPIAAFVEVFRVLKKGGIFFFVIPDKRYTFDKKRPRTPLKHLVRDYYLDSSDLNLRNRNHLEEWVRLVYNLQGDEAKQRVKELEESGLNIHWHVWIKSDIINLLCYLRKQLKIKFKVVVSDCTKEEFLFVLKKVNMLPKDRCVYYYNLDGNI